MRKLVTLFLAVSVFWLLAGGFIATSKSTKELYEEPELQDESTPKKETQSPNPKTDTKNQSKTSPTTPRNSPKTSPTKDEKNDEKNDENQKSNTATGNTASNSNSNTKGDNSTGFFGNFDIWTILLWLLFGIISLAILGALGFLAYRFFSNFLNRERDNIQSGFTKANRNNLEIGAKVSELEKTVKLQSGQFAQIQTSLQSLQRQISDLGGQNPPSQAIFTQPVYRPEPKFPVAAEEYLGKIGGNAQSATADLIGGVLMSNPEKGKEFLIVRDNDLADGLFYAVPSLTRFSTKSDYFNHYQNYYRCENPAGGTLWIKSPATVRRSGDGWQMVEMGELEVRLK